MHCGESQLYAAANRRRVNSESHHRRAVEGYIAIEAEAEAEAEAEIKIERGGRGDMRYGFWRGKKPRKIRTPEDVKLYALLALSTTLFLLFTQ